MLIHFAKANDRLLTRKSVTKENNKPKIKPMAAEEKKEEVRPTKRFKIQGEGAEGIELLFEQRTVSKGKNSGETYWTPKEVNLNNLTKAWGEQNVLDTFVNQRLNQFFIGLCREVTDDDGVFKEDEFLKMANELSLRGDSIPDMKARIAELSVEFCEYDVANASHIPHIARISKEMRKLNEAIRNKRRKTDEDKAAEAEPAKIAA